MYIVAIAWLYVLALISIMQPTVFRGIVTFVGAGLLPLGLVLYVMGSPRRRRDQARRDEASASPIESPADPAEPPAPSPEAISPPDRSR
ncbi:MAG TPA: hypothetical protein PK359_16705 [Burkholderiaceae bacterium]|jgi:hypothetical protein|nr:hypothetical protein [Burkholderiaceae bacterium]